MSRGIPSQKSVQSLTACAHADGQCKTPIAPSQSMKYKVLVPSVVVSDVANSDRHRHDCAIDGNEELPPC